MPIQNRHFFFGVGEKIRTSAALTNQVKAIEKDNGEIKNYYTKLDQDIASCIQKVGLVRYNAFKDVGSDLSFNSFQIIIWIILNNNFSFFGSSI